MARNRSTRLSFSRLNSAVINFFVAEIFRCQIGRTTVMYFKYYPKTQILLHQNNVKKCLVFIIVKFDLYL